MNSLSIVFAVWVTLMCKIRQGYYLNNSETQVAGGSEELADKRVRRHEN